MSTSEFSECVHSQTNLTGHWLQKPAGLAEEVGWQRGGSSTLHAPSIQCNYVPPNMISTCHIWYCSHGPLHTMTDAHACPNPIKLLTSPRPSEQETGGGKVYQERPGQDAL